jgi:hypothetical protein
MIQATLSKVDARGAILDEVSFIQAHLEDADFTDASMKGAKFIQAQAQGAVFVRADVSGASGVGDLDGADLTDAKGKPSAQALRWLLLLGGAGVVLLIALIIVWRSKGIAREDTLLDLAGSAWSSAGVPQTGPPPPGPGLPGNVGPTAGGPQTGPPPPGPG